MGKGHYFLDTYALVEITKGNPEYKKFLQETTFTSLYNLYELYYVILRDFNQKLAEIAFEEFRGILIDVEKSHIVMASEVKLKRKIAYVDCLGYAIAKIEDLAFVTGDSDFKEDDALFS